MTNFDQSNILQSAEFQQELGIQRTFMARVYGWMTIGLLITALTALVVASDRAIAQAVLGTGLLWVLIIAQLGVVIVFSAALNKLPVPVAATLFLIYSALTGTTLSIILLVYTASSVASTFFITAGMFGGMSAVGYITKRDLSGVGSFCIMGLWGIILASIVNIFLRNPGMYWIISFIGVIVFTGLTAYDTQKIKQSYAINPEGSAAYQKTALYGAFTLYLDFINLFLMLLRLMGNRRN
jgi:FtsH-binding integral membrane protein